jgi:DNA repair exonuclease SbcCD nuclease subunit
MVRFLHTSDWQMGMKAVQMGPKARAVRETRYDTISRISDLAHRQRVDFLIVAGDMFDDPDTDDAVIRRVTDVLNGMEPTPVFVLPGNHDPVGPGSIWTRVSWRTRVGPNVHLLNEPNEVRVNDEVALYPCPLKQKRTSRDPTAWIPARATGDVRFRIGVAHGGLDVLGASVNFPIPADRPGLSGLDYLALGDWHGLRIQGRCFYPGTPEPTAFDERDPGNVLLVDITETGATPSARPERVATLHWCEEDPQISDLTDVTALEHRLKSLGSYSSLVVRLRPRLTSSIREVQESLAGLRLELEQTTFFLDWPEESLRLPALMETPLPEGLITEADVALATKNGVGSVARSPELISDARSTLRQIVQEERE